MHWSIVAVIMSPNDFEHGEDVQSTYHIGVWVFLVYSTSLVLGWQSTFSISLLSGNGMSPHLIFPPFSYCIQLYNSRLYFDLSYHSPISSTKYHPQTTYILFKYYSSLLIFLYCTQLYRSPRHFTLIHIAVLSHALPREWVRGDLANGRWMLTLHSTYIS